MLLVGGFTVDAYLHYLTHTGSKSPYYGRLGKYFYRTGIGISPIYSQDPDKRIDAFIFSKEIRLLGSLLTPISTSKQPLWGKK